MNLVDLTKAGVSIKSLFRELDRFSNYDKLDKIQAEEQIKEFWNIVWYDFALTCEEDETLNKILKDNKDEESSELTEIGMMLQKKYAKKAFVDGLKNYPSIICVEHNGQMSCTQFQSNCDTEILNDICNDTRSRVIKQWEINKTKMTHRGIFNRRGDDYSI